MNGAFEFDGGLSVTRLVPNPPSLEAIGERLRAKLLARMPHDPDSNCAACRRLASILRERIDASTIERAILALGSPEQKANAHEIAKTLAAKRCGRPR